MVKLVNFNKLIETWERTQYSHTIEKKSWDYAVCVVYPMGTPLVVTVIYIFYYNKTNKAVIIHYLFSLIF